MLWKNTQHSWAGGQLDAELMGRQDLEKYFNGAYAIENMSIKRQGNLCKRRGTNFVANISGLVPSGSSVMNKVRLFPVCIDREAGYYVLLTGGYAYLVSGQGVRTTGTSSVAWTNAPTTSTAFRVQVYTANIDPQEVNFCQIGDNLYLAHKLLKPCYVKVDYDSLTAPLTKVEIEFNAWKWGPPKINSINDSNMYKTTQVATTSGTNKTTTTTYYYKTARTIEGNSCNKYQEAEMNVVGTAYSSTAKSYSLLPTVEISYVATYVKDGIESAPCQPHKVTEISPWQEGDYIKITLGINEEDDGPNTEKPDYYNVYKRTGTVYGLIASVEGTSTTAGTDYVIDDYITPDASVQPPQEGDAFKNAGEYPSCVGQYQQRLIYAASANEPFKFWMSAVGDLHTFEPHPTIQENDALSAELAATESPNINHIAFNRDIVMFTDGGEWRVSPVSGNALTYKTLSATLQSGIGSVRYVAPVTVGSEILFVERSGQTVRSLGYNFSSDGYETHDLSILAQSMFTGRTIRRICYRQYPESTIYCLLDDGTLAALTYMKEHEVVGWTKVTMGGGYLVEDIASNKMVDVNSADVTLAVHRTVSGVVSHELWRMRPENNAAAENESTASSVRRRVCLDCARELTTAAAQAAWEDGLSVAVDIATGVRYSTSGSLPANHNFVYGYRFGGKLITVFPEPRGTGTAQFEIKNARSCEVRVHRSGGFSVRSASVASDKATVATGDVNADVTDCRVNLVGSNARDGRVIIESWNAEQLNLISLSTVYQIEAEDQEGGEK